MGGECNFKPTLPALSSRADSFGVALSLVKTSWTVSIDGAATDTVAISIGHSYHSEAVFGLSAGGLHI